MLRAVLQIKKNRIGTGWFHELECYLLSNEAFTDINNFFEGGCDIPVHLGELGSINQDYLVR